MRGIITKFLFSLSAITSAYLVTHVHYNNLYSDPYSFGYTITVNLACYLILFLFLGFSLSELFTGFNSDLFTSLSGVDPEFPTFKVYTLFTCSSNAIYEVFDSVIPYKNNRFILSDPLSELSYCVDRLEDGGYSIKSLNPDITKEILDSGEKDFPILVLSLIEQQRMGTKIERTEHV